MAKATQFVQDGKVLDYTNSGSSAIDYLEIVPGTDKIFVAAEKIAASATGGVFAEGVFELPAKAADAFTVGQKVYYSTTDGITSTATSNVPAGFAIKAKTATTDTTALIKINA